jgi:hypothetical protein
MGNRSQEVVVTDIHMRFWSIVFFMVKFSIASIPAVLILGFVSAVAFGIITGFLDAMGLMPV